MKKSLSLLLAIMMIASIGTVAFAADPSPSNIATTADPGVTGEAGVRINDNSSVNLLKELVIYNVDGKNIYLPSVTYTYTIAPATVADGTTVTDSDNITAKVYPGIAGSASITPSVSFGPDDTDLVNADFSANTIDQPVLASADGTSYYKPFNVAFDMSKWTGTEAAGIYRYVITEASTDRDSAGITLGTGSSATRFLDVYVRGIPSGDNHDGEYGSYEIYGYVCFTNNTSIPTTEVKTNGFVHGTTLADVADQYKTVNLKTTKVIDGSPFAEKGHEFPFTLTLSAGKGIGARLNAIDSTGNITGSKAEGFTVSGSDTYATLAASTVLKAGLSNNKNITIYGIPEEANPTVIVKEKNDTRDVYTLSESHEHTSTTDLAILEDGHNPIMDPNREKATAAVAVDNDGDAMTAITFTNTLTEISPTGLVLRFAPYVLMLGFGIVLMSMSKNRKRDSAAA